MDLSISKNKTQSSPPRSLSQNRYKIIFYWQLTVSNVENKYRDDLVSQDGGILNLRKPKKTK